MSNSQHRRAECDTRICDELLWNGYRERFNADAGLRNTLVRQAEPFLHGPGFSVTDKTVPAFSGNRHDYISLSVYDWPNPDTPDGLPWIHRDGLRNPETLKYDAPRLVEFCRAIGTLTAAAKLTGERKYAERAGFLLRRWFLDPETAMTPHLNYAQFVPGVESGSPWGLIDAHFFCRLNESVRSLEYNGCWTPEDRRALDGWMTQYLLWLAGNPLPVKEEKAFTNHGTWYDVQFVSVALLLGQEDLARRQLREKSLPRLSVQLQYDGGQPFELARTLSLSYSVFNLTAWSWLSLYARKLGLELWTTPTNDGATLEKAFRLLLPALTGKKEWIHTQIVPADKTESERLLALAALLSSSPELEEYLNGKAELPVAQRIPCMVPERK